ncbi:MAG: HAMP domain-containing histidine kinase [Thermoleophilaceae bacterium]|nr:HAMP domain-containing histidine kinase [Thermoleophilaceae bacterium]
MSVSPGKPPTQPWDPPEAAARAARGPSLRTSLLRVLVVELTAAIVIIVAAVVTLVSYANFTDTNNRNGAVARPLSDFGVNSDSVHDQAILFAARGDQQNLKAYRAYDKTARSLLRQAHVAAVNTSASDRSSIAEIEADYERFFQSYAQKSIQLAQSGDREAALRLITSKAADDSVTTLYEPFFVLYSAKTEATDAASARLKQRAISGVAVIVIASMLALAAIFIALARLRKNATLPIEQLIRSSRKFGAGELSTRVEPRGAIEVIELSESFNTMADRLENRVRSMSELDAMKTRMVATVGHDLRQPATAIKGFLELVEERFGDEVPDELRSYLSGAGQASRGLNELVDDLMVASQLQEGTIALNETEVNLNELLKSVILEQQPAAQKKGIEIAFIGADEISILGDQLRLRQIFTNLVSNAVKFNRVGEPILVRLGQSGRGIEVAVIDHGIGIASDELGQLGERFFRSDSSKGVEGTGLGLAIVREMLALHGGELDVVSTVGEGSMFTARLPLSRLVTDSVARGSAAA